MVGVPRIFINFAALILILLWMPLSGIAAISDVTPLINDAMELLELEKDSEDLGVLTNAHYVLLDGQTTEKYVYAIEKLTSCSVGKGNLLFFNERPKNALIIVLAHRTTRQCVVIRYDGIRGKFNTLSLKKSNIQDSDFFYNASSGASGKETFHIATILTAWFNGAPFDFLQSAELHGHVCPGIIFGYFTAKSIAAKYPLRGREKYIFIASPNECKDDAIQVILGLTPGKKNLIVKPVNKVKIKKPTGTIITGILIKWSENDNKGSGVVLGIDIDAVKAIVEVDQHMPRNLKVLAVGKLLKHLPDFLSFFSAVREFPVTKDLKEKLIDAGTNPYVVLDMMLDPVKVSGTD